MEDIEVPTEHLHEEINERAEEQKNAKKWSLYVAVSTALMAVLAAIASLLAGHHSNEAVIEQIRASDQWAYYQAKGIKEQILAHAPMTLKDSIKMEKEKKDQQSIKKEAESDEKSSEFHLNKHVILARSVTLFQIAIAISAISIVTGKRFLWYIAMIFAITGVAFFAEMFF